MSVPFLVFVKLGSSTFTRQLAPTRNRRACFNDFQNETKILRSNEAVTFLERESKYNATILSFFSGKASNGPMKK